MTKTISVVMATYNGERFIEEQLLSIVHQTRKPDEIIISDDGSTDRTVEIVRQFIEDEKDSGIKIELLTDNPKHGFTGNFEWAASHTTGDYIFFSDQDDIWLPEKFERVLSVFESHPDALLVFHDVDEIDKAGKPLLGGDAFIMRRALVGVCPKNEASHLQESIFLTKVVINALCLGMTMCLRGSFLKRALPFPAGVSGHDNWLPFYAVCLDGAFFVNSVLAHHRVHDANVSRNYDTGVRKIKRIFSQLKKQRAALKSPAYYNGLEKKKILEELGKEGTDAYFELLEGIAVEEKVQNAYDRGGIIGAWMLLCLFVKNKRYRKSGAASFAYSFLALLMPAPKA